MLGSRKCGRENPPCPRTTFLEGSPGGAVCLSWDWIWEFGSLGADNIHTYKRDTWGKVSFHPELTGTHSSLRRWDIVYGKKSVPESCCQMPGHWSGTVPANWCKWGHLFSSEEPESPLPSLLLRSLLFLPWSRLHFFTSFASCSPWLQPMEALPHRPSSLLSTHTHPYPPERPQKKAPRINKIGT